MKKNQYVHYLTDRSMAVPQPQRGDVIKEGRLKKELRFIIKWKSIMNPWHYDSWATSGVIKVDIQSLSVQPPVKRCQCPLSLAKNQAIFIEFRKPKKRPDCIIFK